MANLTQVMPGGVDRPDVALKEDLDAIAQVANNAKAQAQETSDFLETRVPVGRTINSMPLDEDIVIDADSIDTYDKSTIDSKISAVEAGGYNPVHVNGHLLDQDVILSAGDVGAYSSSEVDGKVANLVPKTRTVNGKPLDADVTISASDLNVYTKTEVDGKTDNFVTQDRKINGKNLSSDITLTLSDLGGADGFVPRTFKINNKDMSGVSLDLTADDIGAISQSYVDDKLSKYIGVDNQNGLGNAPYPVTDKSFAENVGGSGFYSYAAGTTQDDQGNTVPTSVSDRPTGSQSGRVVILTNKATYDQDGNVVTPASQDLLAFPNDLDGLWFKKSGSTVWQQVGAGGAGDLPYPNVWAPMGDTLAITAGSAPYDTITIGGDSIDLNSKSVTFTRSTVATYVDNAGVLQSAEVDEARFERQGILIEGPSVNALFNSNTLTSWQKTTNATVTAGAAVGPDGVNASANKLSLTTASGEVTAQGSVRADTFAANGNVAFSIFAKASERSLLQLSFATSVSSLYANFDLINGTTGGNATVKSIQKLGNGWFRCSVVVKAAAVPASGSNFSVKATIINALGDTLAPSASGVAGDSLFLFGGQVEALPFASSYFPTGNTAPTTGRAADMASMRGAANWNAGPFTLFAEVHTNWDATPPNEAPRVFDLGGTVATGVDYVSLAVGWNTAIQQATAVIGDGAAATQYAAARSYSGRNIMVAMRYDGTALDVAANGMLSAKTAVPYTIGNSSTALRIGGQATDGIRHLFGHIKNLRVWHRALKDSEVKGLQ